MKHLRAARWRVHPEAAPPSVVPPYAAWVRAGLPRMAARVVPPLDAACLSADAPCGAGGAAGEGMGGEGEGMGGEGMRGGGEGEEGGEEDRAAWDDGAAAGAAVLRVEQVYRGRGAAVMPLLPYTSVWPHRPKRAAAAAAAAAS